MPRFDFHCADCGREFEESVSGAPAVINCLFCGEKTAERQFRPGSIQINIPTHFALKHVTAGWHLPRKENGKVDYSDLCRPGEIRPPAPRDELGEWLQKDLGLTPDGRERITLSSTASTDGT